MKDQIKITVIATGFDNGLRNQFGIEKRKKQEAGSGEAPKTDFGLPQQDLEDKESQYDIPTFLRR